MLRRKMWLFGIAIAIGCTPATAPVAPAPSASVAVVAPPAPPKFPDGWPYAPGAGAVAGANGMVSTDAELGSKVGTEILAGGGNAVDAAVATAFALAVVHPAAGNIGGGGFMVARIDGKAYALDFREAAPGAASPDMYLGPDKRPTRASRTGHLASGVPGSVAGLWEAHQKLGSKTKSWADLIAPAIKLAEEGFIVSAGFAGALKESFMVDRLRTNQASAELFYPGGAPLAAGARWKNPELGAVLRRIAEKGPAGFYEGPTAEAIAAEMKRGGGIITLDDLKSYKAKWREPIEFTYRGQKVVSMPPPSSGGVTLAMMCHIAEGFDLAKLGWHAPAELHFVVESMRRAYVARNQKLGDPDFVKMPVDELLSDAWAKTQRASIEADKATPTTKLRPEGAGAGGDGHTTHFSVVDAKGNAVGLTTTLNWWYGSGVTIPGMGFLMNNEMDDFAAKPGTANSYGLVQGEPNAIAPGKRMLSSMTPTIVTGADGTVRLVAGAAGGSTITTTVFHILSNVVDFGLDVASAVNAPRFHMQDFPDQIVAEERGIDMDLRRALEAMGYKIVERGHIADAPAIGRGPRGWIGAHEPRRSGGGSAGW